MSEGNSKKKWWMIAAIGCGVILLVGGLGLGAIAYFGAKIAKDIKADMENPEEKTKSILGVEAIPQGLYPQMAMSIPFVMEMAILGDQPKTSGDQRVNFQGFNQGFFYMKLLSDKDNSTKFETQLLEQASDGQSFSSSNMNIRFSQMLVKGTVEVPTGVLTYRIQRGVDFSSQDYNGDTDPNGVSLLFSFRCPKDNKMRIGYWFQRGLDLSALDGGSAPSEAAAGEADPAAPAPEPPAIDPAAVEQILAQTPFSAENIEAFFSQTNFCK